MYFLLLSGVVTLPFCSIVPDLSQLKVLDIAICSMLKFLVSFNMGALTHTVT